MIAGGRDEGELRAVGVPLDVGPVGAAADDVIAEGGAMGVGRHLEAGGRSGLDIDDHPADSKDHAVARHRDRKSVV